MMNQEEIGRFIAELRKEKGWTQEELANQLYTTQKSVSRWETGRNTPSIDMMLDMADLFEVGVEEILSGKRKNAVSIPSVNNDTTLVTLTEAASEEREWLVKELSQISVVNFFCIFLALLLHWFGTANLGFPIESWGVLDILAAAGFGVSAGLSIVGLSITVRLRKTKGAYARESIPSLKEMILKLLLIIVAFCTSSYLMDRLGISNSWIRLIVTLFIAVLSFLLLVTDFSGAPKKGQIKKSSRLLAIVTAIGVLAATLFGAIMGYLILSTKAHTVKYTKVSDYNHYRTSEDLNLFSEKGMMEIWPTDVTERMVVKEFMMIDYNPFDSNYLGYMVVEYSKDEYELEANRLSLYNSTDYIGKYGVTGFINFDVLAMQASDSGFVYAITDKSLFGENNRVIYVEIVFPGYACDLECEKYIPEEFLPDGLNVSQGNPRQLEMIHRWNPD